ncbi:MAG: glycerol-3-phosphate 1-O-acyltransferase PlsY [Oscillospiraceae bacterium]|nr:glycerol-3-phosphate 1-O-acyltransferase PlsY [Oscillospiraceae bacterium]
MEILKYVLLILGSYAVGSLNGSILLTGILRIRDIRSQGSGNAGATNMARVYGWGCGILTLALDMLKGFLCTLAGRLLLGDWGIMAGGLACLIGHCYPIYYHFKGGKGISVGAMLCLAVGWQVLAAAVAAFLIGALSSKKVSLGSVLALISFPIATWIFNRSLPLMILALCTAALGLFQHRGNIKRLLNGTEPDFRAAKAPKPEK